MSHQEYLQYIVNAKGPTEAQFDDDWEPIGPMVRRDLRRLSAVETSPDGKMALTEFGRTMLIELGGTP